MYTVYDYVYKVPPMYVNLYVHVLHVCAHIISGVHLGGGGYRGAFAPACYILTPLGKLDHLEDFASS